MESTEVDSLAACLLQWVRSFEGLVKIESLKDLDDGIALQSILKEIDEEYFAGDLPETEVNTRSDWTRKWQNLKHVEKQVSTYYRDICNGQEQINAESVPDSKAIAAESSVREMEKLIMAIIRAAMASPESNQKMAQRLMGLGRDSAMVIANELRNMEEPESEPVSRDESAYHSDQDVPDEPKANGTKVAGDIYQDPLLEREEELLRAHSTIDKLQASQSEAQKRFDELRVEKDRIEEAFDTYRNEIESKGRKAAGDDTFKKLQRQADNDRAYIDDLESQMQSSRATIENYERQLERHKDEGEDSQKLRDDLQMLRAENEDLIQKIKANENLKKKIQSLQEQEKVNVSLKEDIKHANERLEELDKLKTLQARLEKEVIEKQGLIRNQEYQINELTTTRKHAEYDARTLHQKLQEARERHDRDHEAIQELKNRLQENKIDDSTTDNAMDETGDQKTPDAEHKAAIPTNNETKHFAEKLALLEQQLEAADVRLKQASERNAALEEQTRGNSTDSEDFRKAKQQVEEREQTITNLRRDLEAATKQRADGPALTQDMAALQRENHLMSAAWFDLSSRLQNNGVSLGRRRQEPKSWIGKQRALVGPGTGLGHR